MDLVDYSEDRFNEIVAAYKNFSSRLDITDIKFIPISALHGDNVVDCSDKTPWYGGGTLLHHLETVHVGADRNLQDCRFPRPVRHSAPNRRPPGLPRLRGTHCVRRLETGDKVVALPSGKESTIDQILVGDTPLDKAFPPLSVTMTLTDDIDLSRGDMLVRANNQPESTQALDARLCWLSEAPLNPATRYVLASHHARRSGEDHRSPLPHRHQHPAPRRRRCHHRRQRHGPSPHQNRLPLLTDGYKDNRSTGSFILVDPHHPRSGVPSRPGKGLRFQARQINWTRY